MRNNWFSKIKESLKIKWRYLNRVFLPGGLRREVPHLVRGFTLIELLVVIGIVAILATVVILSLNPSQLLSQSRDGRRISEIISLDRAIALALTQNPDIYLGSSTYIYLSLPDTDNDNLCNEYPDLPPLAGGWNYVCNGQDTIRKVDGTGWLPVNFVNLPMVPVNNLAVDPLNTTRRGFYYSYAVKGDSWELNAQMESDKYRYEGSEDKEGEDGGDAPLLFEKGSNLGLIPKDANIRGLVELKVPKICGDTLGGMFNTDFYTVWQIPIPSKVFVTKIWLWQKEASLSSSESVEVAIYSNSPPYARLMDPVSIYGTGDNTSAPLNQWASTTLVFPILLNMAGLGNGLIFGLDSQLYNLAYDGGANCAGFLPNAGGGEPVGYLETNAQFQDLRPNVPIPPFPNTEILTTDHIGSIGISYTED